MAINRRNVLLGTGAALALGLAAPKIQAQSAKTITVVFPHPGAIQHFPIHAGIGEGYFKEEGINVRIEVVDGSGLILQALAAGQAQIGHPGPGPLLAARSNKLEAVFIYNHFAKSQMGLFVEEASEFRKPADLKGKVIGVGTADGAEVAFVRPIFKELNMVEGKDYEFLIVGDGGMATAAFLRKDIDGYVGAFADAAILKMRGAKLREITPEKNLNLFGNGYVTTTAFLAENRDVIEGFGRAIVRATHFAMNPANTDAVLKHTAVANPQEGEDRAFAAALLESARERVTPAIKGKGWGYNHPEQWAQWHESLLATGVLKQPLANLDKAYTNEFVEVWNKSKGQ